MIAYLETAHDRRYCVLIYASVFKIQFIVVVVDLTVVVDNLYI